MLRNGFVDRQAVRASLRVHELASVQQGIWLDQIAHPDLPYYNIGMSLEIKGEVNIPLFEKAIEMVANRNDTLRLSFSHEAASVASGSCPRSRSSWKWWSSPRPTTMPGWPWPTCARPSASPSNR
ncbi:condensation domain-containing protein [Pseudomonas sp. PCH446]